LGRYYAKIHKILIFDNYFGKRYSCPRIFLLGGLLPLCPPCSAPLAVEEDWSYVTMHGNM